MKRRSSSARAMPARRETRVERPPLATPSRPRAVGVTGANLRALGPLDHPLIVGDTTTTPGLGDASHPTADAVLDDALAVLEVRAAEHLASARAVLFGGGLIDAAGAPTSTALPPDMTQASTAKGDG